MKSGIHPLTHTIKATCHCGAEFTLVSTIDHDLSLEVCSQCHPFYTGKKHLIDAAGRVDRYRERLAKTKTLRAAAEQRAKTRAERERTKKDTTNQVEATGGHESLRRTS